MGSVLANGRDVNAEVLVAKHGRFLDDGGGRETADQIIDRVTTKLAAVEQRYSQGASSVRDTAAKFRSLMATNRFWPSGRILNSCGTRQGQMSSCFVLPLADNFNSILETLGLAANCHRGGGGTGFDLSPLRERGATIHAPEAAGASGPVSWLQLFDVETAVVMAGGKMRGANMASLDVRHPDIIEFINAKSTVGQLPNFNISVAIDDRFMRSLEAGDRIDLVSPVCNRVSGRIEACDIWYLLCENAWRTGDPGVLFVDAINRGNRLYDKLGPLRTTNPCGEQMLYPYEPSNLGSINLAVMCRSGDVDMAVLEETVADAVHLLDNAVDASRYPDARIAAMAQANRRLGLGVMGFADLLVVLGVRYDSEAALRLIDKIGEKIRSVAWDTSRELAKLRGVFPNWSSSWESPVRNCAITTIAPTGTISMVAGCSSGIEPRFAAYWNKDVLYPGGVQYIDKNLVDDVCRAHGVSPADAAQWIRSGKPLELPLAIAAKYRYAHDVSGLWHTRIAARWQRYTDNGVSKTVNLPATATAGDVDEVFRTAWREGCKGICVYREGSRDRDLLERRQEAGTADQMRQSKLLVSQRNV